MFAGIKFKTKVLNILKDDFKYEPGFFQLGVLRMVCTKARKLKVNEYDAAIMFMLSQINALSHNQETQVFVKKHLSQISKILEKAVSPNSEILSMIEIVAKKHEISLKNSLLEI